MELEDEQIWTEINIDWDKLTDLPWSYLWAIQNMTILTLSSVKVDSKKLKL